MVLLIHCIKKLLILNSMPEDSDVKSNDDSAQGKKPKNSDALGRKSLPQPPCNGDEVATSSDLSPSSFIVQNLHATSSEPVFSSCESPLERARPRAKSVPTMVEQQVALFLRSVSDDINNSYGNSSRVKTVIKTCIITMSV